MTFQSVFLLATLGTLTTTTAAASAPQSYRVSGIALDSRTGAPIPFCRLRLTEEAEPGSLARRGRNQPPREGQGREGQLALRGIPTEDVLLADARGRFSLPVEHAGRWRLSGVARGYRTQALNQHDGLHEALVLTEQQPAATVTLRLDADAEVSGLVLDEAGEPVRQAQVVAEEVVSAPLPLNRRSAASAQTDDLGRYDLAGLAPGRYRLRVQARPWYAEGAGLFINRGIGAAVVPAASPLDPSLDVVYPLTYYPGKDEERLADILTLAGGEQRQADFHLEPLPATHLILPRPPATSEADARVRSFPLVTRISEDGSLGPFAQLQGPTSQTESAWNIGGLTPGIYEVRLPGSDGRPGDPQQIEVRPGRGGTLELPPAPITVPVTLDVSGAEANTLGPVTFTDLATGRVVSEGGRVGFRGRRAAAEDGAQEGQEARVVRLVPGRYSIAAPGTPEAYVTGVSVNGEGAHANGMTVEISGGAPSLVFALAGGRASLTGVASRGGATVAAGLVLLVPVAGTGEIARAETASDGSFTLGGLVPGPYIAVAIEAGWGVNWRDAATLERYLPHGMAVELKPGGKTVIALPAVLP